MESKKCKVLLDEYTIRRRIKELGEEIGDYYRLKTDSIIAICVLKGSIHFFSELVLNIPLDVYYSFVHVFSYAGTQSTGRIRVNTWLDVPITDKYVLLVEDIIDTGRTVGYILNYLKRYKPRDLKLAALLEKKAHDHGIHIDFLGFQIPDEFVIGFGLDHDGKFRNLPYIGYFEK